MEQRQVRRFSLVDAYMKHFGLKRRPFSITPDPEFFFLSESHREALNSLSYGVYEGMGFTLITGEVGTGKTILARYFVETAREELHTALVFNPRLSERELLLAILEDLGILGPEDPRLRTKKALIDRLNEFLIGAYREGKRVAVILDEAQNLSDDALEFLRLLSNLEVGQDKLLQLVLIGQPELEERLQTPQLRQLNQRILVRYRLSPLRYDEMELYIHHRLTKAGGLGVKFAKRALKKIYKASGGVPRKVNAICELSMIAAYVDGVQEIRKGHVKRAVATLGMRDKERAGLMGMIARVLSRGT